MAYGTPRAPEEIETYYTDIRRGRPPTAEQLADLTRRYEAIGGTSPLAARTEAQRDALQRALDARQPGRFVVRIGLKHADPKIEAGVAELAHEGAERVVGLVLAPHYSALSVGEYLGRAGAAAAEAGLPFAGIESWATEPAYVEFLAEEVRRRLADMPANSKVVFTAHSLPRRVLDAGDPYPDELRATATAVAAVVGLDRWSQWSIAWQSAGRTPEPWIGPDVLSVIDELAASRERRRAARVPVRVRVRPPRGVVRPRHRGTPAGAGPRVDLRPNGVDERRPGGDRRTRRARRRTR